MREDETFGIVLAKKGSKDCTLALDYDDMPLAMVRELASDIAELNKLGNFLIIESSSEKYHVVFYQDILDWPKTLRILGKSGCDEEFVQQAKYKGFLRLRIGEKNGFRPNIVEEVRTNYSKETLKPILKKLWK